MVNNLTPLYLSSLIPTTVNETSGHNLRNANNISTINVRAKPVLPFLSPFYNKRLEWSQRRATNSKSVASFKHTLSQTNICVTKYFFVSDKRSQVLHTRFRAKCSAQNYEIYLKNLTYTPLCRCGNNETSEQFFLHCRYYHRQRLE